MKPKVLVTVDGGVAQVYAKPSEVDVFLVDYDNEAIGDPAPPIPPEFEEMPDYFAALQEQEETNP